MAPWPWCRICNLVWMEVWHWKVERIFSYGTQEKAPALRKLAKDDRVASWLSWLNHTIISPLSSIITCEWWMFFLLRRRSATPWGWEMKRSPIPNGDIRNRWQPRLGARCESWCWWYFIPKSELSLLFHASLDVIQVWRGQVQAVAEKQKRPEKRLLAW